MRKLIESLEKKDQGLWDRYGGQDEGIDRMLTSLGFNPGVQPKTRKKVCPECGKNEMVMIERHADTDMNYMEHKCKACGYEKEL